jgi:hypothetical protein
MVSSAMAGSFGRASQNIQGHQCHCSSLAIKLLSRFVCREIIGSDGNATHANQQTRYRFVLIELRMRQKRAC